MRDLEDIVNQLRSQKTERECLEFKVNWFEPKQIGE